MKKLKNLTVVLLDNGSRSIKTITINRTHIRLFMGGICLLFFLFVLVLTDYLFLSFDVWEFSKLKEENRHLKQRFVVLSQSLENLERTVQKSQDFTKKIQQIITISPEQQPVVGFGKTHYNFSAFPLLQSESTLKNLRSSERSKDLVPCSPEKCFCRPHNFDELEIRVNRLKGKSRLLKQNSWDIYSDLLEKTDLLNSTPSISPIGKKGYISSRFGYRNETVFSNHEPDFHNGIDFALDEGNAVVSTADGKVVYTGFDETGYGNFVVVDHGYGLRTYYAHLADIKTNVGKKVRRGEIIATVGNTGHTTGPHLHYEIRISRIPVNPKHYILDQTVFDLLNL